MGALSLSYQSGWNPSFLIQIWPSAQEQGPTWKDDSLYWLVVLFHPILLLVSCCGQSLLLQRKTKGGGQGSEQNTSRGSCAFQREIILPGSFKELAETWKYCFRFVILVVMRPASAVSMLSSADNLVLHMACEERGRTGGGRVID